MIEADDFVKARMLSIQKKQYNSKQLYNNTKLKFIQEYYNSEGILTDNLGEIIREYVILKNGIILDDTCEYIVEANSELMEEILREIENGVNSNFIKFYESYLRKIDNGYSTDFVESALNDLAIAYTTLRQCQQHGKWKVPPVRIMQDEMSNLYKCIKNTNNIQQEKNKFYGIKL